MAWAEAVLPLLALGWGLCLVAMYPDTIATWVAKLDAWRAAHLDQPHGKR